MHERTLKWSIPVAVAAAAMVVFVIVLPIGRLPFAPTQPAYALEQTVAALEAVRFMHALMYGENGQVVDERWFEVGPEGTPIAVRQDSRFQVENGSPIDLLVIDDGTTCAAYHRNKNTVVLHEPNHYRWFYNLRMVLRDLAGGGAQDRIEIEENVDHLGRTLHRVRLVDLNLTCYIDPATKLPVIIGPYQVSYEEPPQGTFDVIIPDGVVLVDQRPGAPATELPDWMKHEKDGDQQFDMARRALAAGQYAEAAELFEAVTQTRPMRNWAWYWLGRARFELGEYDAAIEAYGKVIEMFGAFGLEPLYCYLARGEAYLAKDMQAEAKQDLGKALGSMIKALRNSKEAELFDYADDPENHGTGRTETTSFAQMIERLRRVTGQNFGYDPQGTPEQKEAVIAAWERWWVEHAAEYGASPP